MPAIGPFHNALLASPSSSADSTKPVDLSATLAPPYDQIDRRHAAVLIAQQQHNVVSLEAPSVAFADRKPDAARSAAREALQEWKASGYLAALPDPTFMVLRQTFADQELLHRRHALLARVPVPPMSLGDEAEDRLLDHEEATAGLRDERIAQMEALRCQTSPIVALYDDEYGDIDECLRSHIVSNQPARVGRTEDGVLHELWIVDDCAEIQALVSRFANRPIVIADGHNRYHAHRSFLDRHPEWGTDHPARFCAAALVARQDPGIVLRGMVHVLGGMQQYRLTALLDQLRVHGTVTSVDAPLAELHQHVSEAWMAGSHPIGLHDTTTGSSFVFTTRLVDPLASLLPDRDESWRRADPVIFEHLVVGPILKEKFNNGRTIHRETYTDIHHAVSRCASPTPNVQLAAITLPVNSADVLDLATNHGPLPADSTFFWPSMPAGFVFYPLEE